MLLALSVIGSQGAALGHSAYKVFDECGGSIGRLEDNDWMLPDPDRFISGRHAVLHANEDAFYLEDMSTNGTFVNARDRPLSRTGPMRLQDGDRIYIGEYEILVQLIDQPRIARPASSASTRASAASRPKGEHAQTVPGRTDFMPESYECADADSNSIVSATLFEESAVGASELLDALGLDATRVPPAIYRQLGLVLRIAIQGMIGLLQSRIQIDNGFGTPTRIVTPATENNPLECSADTDEALRTLFLERKPGSPGPAEAFTEAFQEIAHRQLALLAGVRAGFDSLLANVPHDDRGKYQSLFGDELARVYQRELDRLVRASRTGLR
jgi:type VI secretion system protein ImpI